jgi:hypothetical protein
MTANAQKSSIPSLKPSYTTSTSSELNRKTNQTKRKYNKRVTSIITLTEVA